MRRVWECISGKISGLFGRAGFSPVSYHERVPSGNQLIFFRAFIDLLEKALSSEVNGVILYG
jgi:hypothetical protein